ncbi:restriction endonuclease [Haloferula helveola]|uniref:Restriction endonuclease n=1 Tax=Haloferula helveola TaxID=490095 RepID=A0ABN6H895_9BACT|nr:restriction endonuclease [Haloferula helveola]
MKLQFKHKEYQAAAVDAVVDCFAGQPKVEGVGYRLDPGKMAAKQTQSEMDYGTEAFRNAPIMLDDGQLLENIQKVQRGQNLPQSSSLTEFTVIDGKKNKKSAVKASYRKEILAASSLHLDVEMETGTGKTYCYLRSMFELNRRYGWSKFIVVVPSIAIREGVQKSLEITAEHFLQDYGKKARFFTYDSKHPHKLESFSSDGGINVMVINVQAFNATGQDARRIYEELDDFQSRRPIDVIKANHPILILDEPQKMEGKKTIESLKEFNPLFILRYSATHKTEHNKIHRLDALDAYNQKLVKKIRVHGIAQKGLSGTDCYLFLEAIVPAQPKAYARLEHEVRLKSGAIKRVVRRVGSGYNLKEQSGGLPQYEGFVVSEVDAHHDTISFRNDLKLEVGAVSGDITESALRRIQIRETIRAHFEAEKKLFDQGIKVLSLFFIDEVAKYKQYDDDGNELGGEYATAFEEEYEQALNEELDLEDSPYQRFLKEITAADTHNGYFSIDKKSKRLVDPTVKSRGEDAGTADDVDAYDLILRDKETLLSFPGPHDSDLDRRKKQVRFIFSHSALREGWDNPNVFNICTLKHSDSTISRRQEVGRGMRLCVNQHGERMDNPATAHQINVLTVIANESYDDFVRGLQDDIRNGLSDRPRKATEKYFTDKILKTEDGEIKVTPAMATKLHRYLVKQDYVDDDDNVTEAYHMAKKEGTLAELPEELRAYAAQLFQLVDSVYSDAALPDIEDGRKAKPNVLNENFKKKEFQDLWEKINRKAAYTVDFDSDELIAKSIKALDKDLRVEELRFQVVRGEQEDTIAHEDLAARDSFKVKERETEYMKGSIRATVSYDLIGEMAERTQLTRRTVAAILKGINVAVFGRFKANPEAFISKAATLIKEQKATMIIEHLAYDPIDERYDSTIFAVEKAKEDFSKAYKANHHIYDYVFTDSKVEREFVEELDTSAEVVVYAKLPRGFAIPTPVGDYNPDWAVVFDSGKVRHVYFIAETKGSMSKLEIRPIEESKIDCARKFFAKISTDQVKYDKVDSYDELLKLVR